ncbi:MAG: hypothetical protein U1D30_26755 [Planctomycetota bacterium]
MVFLAFLGCAWLVCLAIYKAFPWIQPGSDLVYAAKLQRTTAPSLFPDDAKNKRRVVIFGDSKVLCGFIPSRFDELSGGRTYSFNLGLPNARHFVQELKTLCEHGQVPTDVLLTVPWSSNPPPTLRERLLDDEWLREQIAPFHHFPRDLLLFILRARRSGGIVASYRRAEADVQTMLDQRGFYFIEGQSHFPNHQLPDDYVLQRDDPTAQHPRVLETSGPEFETLLELMKKYHFRVYFVPRYLRATEASQPPDFNVAVKEKLQGYPDIQVLGPDYVLYPNRYFSDIAHLNPTGAEEYTAYLWRLFEPQFTDKPATSAGSQQER